MGKGKGGGERIDRSRRVHAFGQRPVAINKYTKIAIGRGGLAVADRGPAAYGGGEGIVVQWLAVVGAGCVGRTGKRYAEVPVHTKVLCEVLSAAIGLFRPMYSSMMSDGRFHCLARVFASLSFCLISIFL